MNENIIDKKEVKLMREKYIVYLKRVPAKSSRDGKQNSATRAFIKKL